MRRFWVVAGAIAALLVADRGWAIASGGRGILEQAIFHLKNQSGAVDRTAYSKLADWISCKDYGALGDGLNDDTNSVTNCVNAAGATQLLNFPCPGTYITSTYGTLACGVYYPPLSATGAGLRAVSNKLLDSINVRDFGAKCDGTTDDSSAIQNAINYGITNGAEVHLPAAVCAFNTTLNLNITSNGVNLVGETGYALTASVLQYNGSGTALLGTSGGSSIFSIRLSHLLVVPGPTQNASIGISGVNWSEVQIDDVGIITRNSHTFTTGFQCTTGCNIMFITNPTITGMTNAMYLSGPSAVFVSGGNFFQNTNVFKFDGTGSHISIHDNWLESQDVAFLFDDTANVTNLSKVVLSNNRLLFNWGVVSAPNSQAIKFNQTAGRNMIVNPIHYGLHNSYFCSPVTCSATYPIRYASAGTASTIALWVEENIFDGASGGIVASNSTGSNTFDVHLTSNISRDQSFVTLPSDTLFGGGVSTFTSVNETAGTITHNGSFPENFAGGITVSGGNLLATAGSISLHVGSNGLIKIADSGFTAANYIEWRNGSNTRLGYIGNSSTDLPVNLENSATFTINGGALKATSTTNIGTCTLNGASPAVCTATVFSGAKCVAVPQGTTAAAALHTVAVSVSTTTLTVTGANGLTDVVNYWCGG